MKKLVILEEQEAFAKGLKNILEMEIGESIHIEVDVPGNAHLYIRECDIVLLDPEQVMNKEQIIDRYNQGGTKVVTLMKYEKDNIGKVLSIMQLPIYAFLIKQTTTQNIVQGLLDVLRGEMVIAKEVHSLLLKMLQNKGIPTKKYDTTVLTNREHDVFLLLSLGQSNQEIGDKLCLSDNTVAVYVSKILKKLNIKNRKELISDQLY